MTLEEYEVILTDLVLRNKITIQQAQELRFRFVEGEFSERDLPLPISAAKRRNDDEWLLLLLLFVTQSSKRNGLSRREKDRENIQSVFERHVTYDVSRIEESVNEFHSEIIQTVGGAMLANWLAGNGTANAKPNIDKQIDEQLDYLYRFAAEVHVKKVLGQPHSEEYLLNRALMYGGAVWASWFRGNESIGGDNLMAQYIARDDRVTCDPCRRAQGIYPLNSGPFPGEVCLGGYRCRCERRTIEI